MVRVKYVFIIFILSALVALPGCVATMDAETESRLSEVEAVINSQNATDQQLKAAYFDRGWIRAGAQEYETAIADFKKALEIDSKFARAYYSIGWVYQKQNRQNDAKVQFDKAISIDPKLMDAYVDRGWFYYETQQLDLAKADFEKALEIKPGPGDAHEGLSYIYHQRKKLEDAIREMGLYLQAHPEDEDARQYLANLQSEWTAANPGRAAGPSAISNTVVIPGPGVVDETRIALVIGNGRYDGLPTLGNPINDAADMARALRNVGFDVTELIDADRNEMLTAVRDFGNRIKKGGVGLFYYAGHGLQVKGENYLVPVDAKPRHADEVEDHCLKASAVLRKMETAGNRLNIIILDACRNNPLPSGSRSGDQGLARMDAPRGSILAYATAPGATASDGEGRNGLYTSVLLKHLRQPGVEIGQLFRQVRVEVLEKSNEMQVPWESSSLTGQFYFNK